MEQWNRCDHCGKFIAYKDFESGAAIRRMLTPDSYYSKESYTTLCKKDRRMDDFDGLE